MFFPGETVMQTFIVPFDITEISYMVVSYLQHDNIVLEKKVDTGFESQGDGVTKIEFILSQEETLLFHDDAQFDMQCNVYTNSGTRHASPPISSSSGVQYLREVMTDE